MVCSEIERHTETDKCDKVNKCVASSTSTVPTMVRMMHQFNDNKADSAFSITISQCRPYEGVIIELINAPLVVFGKDNNEPFSHFNSTHVWMNMLSAAVGVML